MSNLDPGVELTNSHAGIPATGHSLLIGLAVSVVLPPRYQKGETLKDCGNAISETQKDSLFFIHHLSEPFPLKVPRTAWMLKMSSAETFCSRLALFVKILFQVCISRAEYV